MSYLGIDVGMTGAKALVVGEDGQCLREEYTTYCREYHKNLTEHIVPGHVWDGVQTIIRACRCCRLTDPVKAISISVSGDDFFPMDQEGNPLANVISAYKDTGIEYEEFIVEKLGDERTIYQLTGQPIRNNVYPLHRLLWIKELIG